MGALTMEGFEKLNPFYKKKQNMSTKLTVMAGTYWGNRSCCSFSEVNATLEEKNKEILRLRKSLYTALALMAKGRKFWFSILYEQECACITPAIAMVHRYKRKFEICQRAERECRKLAKRSQEQK